MNQQYVFNIDFLKTCTAQFPRITSCSNDDLLAPIVSVLIKDFNCELKHHLGLSQPIDSQIFDFNKIMVTDFIVHHDHTIVVVDGKIVSIHDHIINISDEDDTMIWMYDTLSFSGPLAQISQFSEVFIEGLNQVAEAGLLTSAKQHLQKADPGWTRHLSRNMVWFYQQISDPVLTPS